MTYFVEPSSLYFKQPQEFHSIIYTTDDVNFNTSSFCNADSIRQSVMNKIPLDDRQEKSDQWKHKYSFDANLPAHRRKRAIDPTKTVCTLYMQADHTFYQKYGSNVDTVVAQLGVYVQAVNNIFSPIGNNKYPNSQALIIVSFHFYLYIYTNWYAPYLTINLLSILLLKDFDSDSSADNIAFLVKRLKVYTDPNAAGYKFNGHYSVEKFLDLHSTSNYNDYCLSYMFANRDFDGGVLGLAWVASLSKAGGVCEIYRVSDSMKRKITLPQNATRQAVF